ncbi:MAG: hypothetical protein Q8Q62_03225 [Mesorhizobium sp.]|nr:hypothetical protein [Mesorhizobium sp.]
MADSDHSMRFVRVTRRKALGGAVIAATGWTFGGDAKARSLGLLAAAAGTGGDSPQSDPAIALWREWAAAHELAERLDRRQQELEAELAERVDGLGTTVCIPGGEPVYVCSTHSLDRIIGSRTDMAHIRKKAEAELASKQAQFDAVGEEIGYFSGLRAEQEGFRRTQALLEALSKTPAITFAGVVAKLDAVMREGEAWEEEDPSAFPWPQIRSVHDDVVRIGRGMNPGLFVPSAER